MRKGSRGEEAGRIAGREGDSLELERTKNSLDLEFADEIARVFRYGLLQVSIG